MWQVSIPGIRSFTIVYNNTSAINKWDDLGMNISATLNKYSREENSIESTVTLTILKHVNMNQTILKCSSAEYSETVNVHVNTSGNNNSGIVISQVRCKIAALSAS